jgi:hypothetical protein
MAAPRFLNYYFLLNQPLDGLDPLDRLAARPQGNREKREKFAWYAVNPGDFGITRPRGMGWNGANTGPSGQEKAD